MTPVRAVAADFGHWRELISDTTVPMEPEPHADGPFHGTVDAHLVDGVALVSVASVAQTVRRTAHGCRRSPAPMVKVLVQRRGRALVEQHDRRAVLGEHTMTVYDAAHPYTVVQTADFRADAVLVPRERLPVTTGTMARAQEHPIDLAHGAGALFAAYLDGLQDRLDECAPATAAHCVQALVELLAAALTQVETKASRTALRDAALDWIRAHLADPGLSPATVAAGTGMSVRYLHRLFEAYGVSVSGYIRGQRLHHIRTDLADPRFRDQTIARIGGRWGMPDQAHLSRLFRREFGHTPGDVRRELDRPA